MEHKAYKFRWNEFKSELYPIMISSLENDCEIKLNEFISSNLSFLSNPYDEEPLDEEWKQQLETHTVQELADFALTKYYDISDNFGLGSDWLEIADNCSSIENSALLGNAIDKFDPGCYGSYFQNPSEIEQSAVILEGSIDESVRSYAGMLRKIRSGLYVTF